ncbi:MAG: argininosuccinate synthase [Chloroflexi bacterium]|nr:MAG: argininosuccinate synthase [Chloroflexota bacterium]
MAEKIVLAYSGGLDTSVAVKWLQETRGFDVITLTVDLGGQLDLEAIRQRALAAGAIATRFEDQRRAFLERFCWRALRAGALYQDQYPLATALGRPLIAERLVGVAREEGATWVAHGSTGKGNDQVRFDVAVQALAPKLRVLAPLRDGMAMTREEEIAYARQHGIPVTVKPASPYSIDENLWGRSIEAGDLEDATHEAPEDAFAWTRPLTETPEPAETVEIAFETGTPVALDGKVLEAVALVEDLNRRGGLHGVGRIDMIEDRFVGIKSREVYEAPAAVILHLAHRALEELVLEGEGAGFKRQVAQEYARLVYQGKWFSAHRASLDAYVASTQVVVEGTVRIALHRGTARVAGRKSRYSLYRPQLATYSSGDEFDHAAARGFITLVGLPLRTQALVQGVDGRPPQAD